MSSEIGWEELEEKVGKIEPGQILELNLLRKGLSNRFPRTLSCVKVTHFVYSQIPKNASLLGIFPDFAENFQKSSKIINLNIREQFQKDVFTSGTDRLKSRSV